MFNFEDFFKKYYYVFGDIIISESFKNDKYYLEILKLDLFAKSYDVLGHSISTKSFGHKCNFMNNVTVAKFKFNDNITGICL